MPGDTKKCPYCAEEIKKDAIYCRFCNHDLPPEEPKPIFVHKLEDEKNKMPPLTSQAKTGGSSKQTKAEKDHRVRNIVLLLIFLFVTILCVMTQTNKGGSGSSDYDRVDYSATNNAAATKKAGNNHTVEYKLTGSATKVDVTLSNASGNTEQYDDVYLDKTYTFKMETGEFMYISAQNQGSSGSVTCKIYVDGTLVESATSSGAYVIASCSGSVE